MKIGTEEDRIFVHGHVVEWSSEADDDNPSTMVLTTVRKYYVVMIKPSDVHRVRGLFLYLGCCLAAALAPFLRRRLSSTVDRSGPRVKNTCPYFYNGMRRVGGEWHLRLSTFYSISNTRQIILCVDCLVCRLY